MTDAQLMLMEKQNDVALIRFNRPQKMNVISGMVNLKLIELLEVVELDPQVKVVILTGTGEKAFVAGGDLKEMQSLDAVGAREYALRAKRAVDKIYSLKKPVIAAINGLCLGGGLEYALACDIRIASENARFALPEINLGIMPGSGGTQRLTRLIGMGRAKELIYTGDMFNAARALELGVVNHVYQQDKLIEEAMVLAQKIATKSPVALELIKRAIQHGIETDLESGYQLEIDCFSLCFSTKEQKDGFENFLSKN